MEGKSAKIDEKQLMEYGDEELESVNKLLENPISKEFKDKPFMKRILYIHSDRLKSFNIGINDILDEDNNGNDKFRICSERKEYL